jgi:23S rRNA pseudouridine955/2504/2580 synthase
VKLQTLPCGVNGVHDFDSISVFYLLPPKDGTAVKIDRQKGKAAETIFFTLKAFKKLTLVRMSAITGRMHQIRVHLQCLKAPIVCVQLTVEKYLFVRVEEKFQLKTRH